MKQTLCRSLLVLAMGAATFSPAAAAASAAATAAQGPAVPAGQSAPATVTLITGDRVLVEPNAGRQGVIIDAADRGPGTAPVAFSTFAWQGDTYVVPSDAIPYLGHPLDLALFDVSALIRDGITGGASLPLTIGYAGSGAPADLPGIDTGGGTGQATEPAYKATEFGRALSAQLQADVATAHGQQPASPPGLFGGISQIGLAAAGPSGGASQTAPQGTFRMQTLTVNAIDRDGNPASNGFGGNGYMIIDNVDNPDWFGVLTGVTGSQKWSVPAGDYEVRAYIFTWFQKQITFQTATGPLTETVWDYNMSFVWKPQIHVNQDTTVTADARTANPIPIPATPDPDTGTGWRHANCCDPAFELVSDRVARNGLDVPYYWMSGGHALGSDDASLEMYAAPSGGATTGAMHFYTYLGLQSPSTHHTYDLIFPTDGTVPSTFPSAVTAGELASIPAGYDSEAGSRPGLTARLSYQPWESASVREAEPITEPATRTEYVLADPAAAQTLWQQHAVMYSTFFDPFADDEFGPYTSYTPGPQHAVTWFAAPRAPGIDQPGPAVPPAGDGSPGMVCPVCRDPGRLSLDIKPYVGGDPGQWAGALDTGNPIFGGLISDKISLRYYENGTLVSAQDKTSNPSLGSSPVVLPMTSGPASYRIDYDVSRSTFWTPLSSQTHTSWAFTSGAPAKSSPLPAGWSCGQLTAPCAAVPMLFVSYGLPLDSSNSAPAPGAFTFTIHLFHQPGSGSSATIGTPTVSVSYDDGSSWAGAAGVSDLGGGDYQVTVDHPAPGTVSGFVSLRVQAADSAGSSIDQTIIGAYILRGSAAAAGGATAGGGTAGTGGAAAQGIVSCPAQEMPYANCDAVLRADASGGPLVTPASQVTPASPPPGYGPADLQSAYALPTAQGTGQTVAVVDAPGDPNIAADVAAYRAEYGLPPCTAAGGCLRIVGQAGGPPPAGVFNNPGWGAETALDLEMVSAACPACHILLVEADDASFDSLAQAEQTAVSLGADAVSNSYGSYEFAGVQDYAPAYRHQGVAIVASSGDNGFGYGGTLGGTQFPASLPGVTAVGGTALTRDTSTARGWSETAWAGAGSGCSAYFAKPAWQNDAHCKMRTVADVAAVADPQTGVAVYDSYLPGIPNQAGWLVAGGTSVAAPVIAGVYGLAGNATQITSPSYTYAHARSLNDVTAGGNGTCGLGNYLCNAKNGYDGPTGLGTPDGTGAF